MLCDRHRGVGADGVVAVPDQPVDGPLEVVVWNADGSLAEVSGNGLRIAALALRPDPESTRAMEFESAGRRYPIVFEPSGLISIELPPPDAEPVTVALRLATCSLQVTEVNVGNPHAVVEADVVNDADWPAIAAELETHSRWPSRVNVERLRMAADRTLAIDNHERGVGPTSASGTGALAAAIAAIHLKRATNGALGVRMAGGEVVVDVSSKRLKLTGPVDPVYEGNLSQTLMAWLLAAP